MAIFEGDWYSGDGVPFDPNSIPVTDTGEGGIAKKLRRKVRETPGRRQHAIILAALGHFWSKELTAGTRAAWNEAAAVLLKETRSGTTPALTGPAFWQRCVHPAETVLCPLQWGPISFPPPVTPGLVALEYVEATETFKLAYSTNEADEGDPVTGIAMFQIHPQRAEGGNESAFTHLIGWTSPLPTVTDEHLLSGVAHWHVPAHLPARAMVRRWQIHHFDRTVDSYEKT